MPWEKAYSETDVVDRATRVFWSRGYEATTMADLVKATGINRGSIYSAFDGKRALFLRALEHYSDQYCAVFLTEIASSHEPRASITAAFEAVASSGAGQPAGCLLINTALEMSPHDYEIAEFVDARLLEVEDFFHDQIVAAIGLGTIRNTVDPRATAQALLGLFIGLRVLCRSSARPSAIPAILTQAYAMLD